MQEMPELEARQLVALAFVDCLAVQSNRHPATRQTVARSDFLYLRAILQLQSLGNFCAPALHAPMRAFIRTQAARIDGLGLEAGTAFHAQNALLGIMAWGHHRCRDDARVALQPFETFFDPDEALVHWVACAPGGRR